MTMKEHMNTLLATITAITLTHVATADLLTFEDLPEPFETYPYESVAYEAMPTVYHGFSWTSNQVSDEMFTNNWGYYNIKEAFNYGGYDNGIYGNRALFTPFGGGYNAQYRIFRESTWMFTSAYFTSAWANNNGVDLHIDGYLDGSIIFNYTVTIFANIKTFVLPPQLMIDGVHVWSDTLSGTSNHFIMDDLTYDCVPAPSALCLIGLAGFTGLVGGRKR